MHPELFRLFGRRVPRRTSSSSSRGFSSRRRSGRSGRGASARAPTSSSTSGSRCCSRAWPARASCTSSPTATSGTTSTSARTRRGSTGRSTSAECLSSAYDGVWDAAKGVCHPKTADCFAWAKFWAGGLTYYGGFIGASARRVVSAQARRFPFWKAADMAGFAIPLGPRVRAHGVPAGGLLLRRDVRPAVGHVVSVAERGERGAVQGRTCCRARSMWSLPVHPTQVYESAASLAIAAVLSARGCIRASATTARSSRRSSRSTRSARFLLEVLRRDDRGGVARAVDVAADRRRARSRARPRCTSARAAMRPGRAASRCRLRPHDAHASSTARRWRRRCAPRSARASTRSARARARPRARRRPRRRRSGERRLHAQQGEGVERGRHARHAPHACPASTSEADLVDARRAPQRRPDRRRHPRPAPAAEGHRRAARARRDRRDQGRRRLSPDERGPARARPARRARAVHARRAACACSRCRGVDSRARTPSSSGGATSSASPWRSSCSRPARR